MESPLYLACDRLWQAELRHGRLEGQHMAWGPCLFTLEPLACLLEATLRGLLGTLLHFFYVVSNIFMALCPLAPLNGRLVQGPEKSGRSPAPQVEYDDTASLGGSFQISLLQHSQ